CDADIVRVYAEVPRELIEYHPNEYIIHLDDDQNVESLSKEGITPISQATINYDMNMALVRTDKLLEMIDRAEENNYYKELDDVIIEYMDDYKTVGYLYYGYDCNLDFLIFYYYFIMQLLYRQ